MSPVGEPVIRDADGGASDGISRWSIGHGRQDDTAAGITVARIFLTRRGAASNEVQGSSTERDILHTSGERTTHSKSTTGPPNPPWPIGSLRYDGEPNAAGIRGEQVGNVACISLIRSPITPPVDASVSKLPSPCRGDQWPAGELTVVSQITRIRLVRQSPLL